MKPVIIKTYLSPTLVLLAFDWEDGAASNDFLGFAVKRTPGFRPTQGAAAAPFSWLPNRIGFNGPNDNGADMPSNTNPLQHFQWWDAQINTEDRGTDFTYEVYPVKGPYNTLTLVDDAKATVTCTIPQTEEQGIGTYFNRAVVSSQAFAREFGHITTHAQYQAALAWLANGMNEGLLNFINKAKGVGLAVASYHLTDQEWVVPALTQFNADASVVYFYKHPSPAGKGGDNANAASVALMSSNPKISFFQRTKTNIMHDKFMVRTPTLNPADAQAVTMGTANYTTEGLTQQANVIHTFESSALAGLYLKRQQLLTQDPSVGQTAQGAAWSDQITIGDANVRVFFAPEAPAGTKTSDGSRLSIDAVVNAVKNAKESVMFSLFSATDKQLLDACLAVAESGKLMRGLVNSISTKTPVDNTDEPENASTAAATWLFERSKDDNMVVGHDSFGANNTPLGFWQESNTLVDPTAPKPAGDAKHFIPPVFVHQKIVIIDGTTDNPIIFVGSANLSGNSTWHNDENLLEITNCPRLGGTYVAEFMRLYEQYRARFSWNNHQQDNPAIKTFSLAKDTSWAAKDYKAGTMEYLARIAFSS